MSSYPEVYHTAPAPTPARDDTRRSCRVHGGFRQPDAGDVHVAVSPSPASATGRVPASRNLDSRAVFLAAGAQAAGFTVTVESTRELLARLDAPTGKTA